MNRRKRGNWTFSTNSEIHSSGTHTNPARHRSPMERKHTKEAVRVFFLFLDDYAGLFFFLWFWSSTHPIMKYLVSMDTKKNRQKSDCCYLLLIPTFRSFPSSSTFLRWQE